MIHVLAVLCGVASIAIALVARQKKGGWGFAHYR